MTATAMAAVSAVTAGLSQRLGPLRRFAGPAGVVVPPALTVVGFLFGLLLISGMALRTDAELFHTIGLEHPYSGLVGDDGAFVYSPAFAQALQPLRVLPVWWFVTLWRVAELGLLTVMAGPWTLLLLLTVPVTAEIMEAQVHMFLAAAIVAAWRWPGLWAIPILTKPTLGVGLLFHVGAHDWRALRIALAWTAGITLVSLVTVPALWVEWVKVLAGSASHQLSGPVILIPLVVRLPVAAALAWYAGRRDWPRLVPIAAMIALPALWIVGLSMAVAAIPDVRRLRGGPVHGGAASAPGMSAA